MSTREMILAAVKRNQPDAVALPDVPRFDQNDEPPLERFKANVERMGGKLAEPGQDLNAFVAQNYPEAKVICAVTPEVTGNRKITNATDPRTLEDVDLGVVRAVFGVAETGSVYLSERELAVNALGYLSQHMLVLLDPADIVSNFHHAFTRPEFDEARYSVLMTVPSATADIEGVLIHGAQGVQSLTVALLKKMPMTHWPSRP